MSDASIAADSRTRLQPPALLAHVRGRMAEVSPAGMTLAGLVGAIPLVQVDTLEHAAWAPKAALALALLPAGLVAMTRLVARGDRAAQAGLGVVCVATVSTLRSNRPLLSLVGPPNVGNGLMFTMCLVGVWSLVRVSSATTRAAVRVAVVVSGVLSGLLAWAGVTLGFFPVDTSGRAAGYTGNPVFLGALAAATAAYCASAAARPRTDDPAGVPNARRWLLFGAAIAGGAVQLTSTRSSALVLIGCGAYVAVRYRRRAFVPVLSLAAGTVAAMACAAVAGTSTIAGRVGAEGVADNVRPLVWRAALAAVRGSVWLGGGPGRAHVSVARRYPASACVLFRTSDVHDLGLQLLVTVGVIGTAATAVWVLLAARQARGPAAIGAVALVSGSLLQPLSLVTAVGVVALLALAAPGVSLGVPTRVSRVAFVVLAIPALVAAALLLTGEHALRQADTAAEARPYALARRVLPPWPELAALGVKANILDSRAAAEQSAVEATQWDPDDDIGWTRLAALQAKDGRVEEAKQNFRRALERNPASYEALQSLASLEGRSPACPTK